MNGSQLILEFLKKHQNKRFSNLPRKRQYENQRKLLLKLLNENVLPQSYILKLQTQVKMLRYGKPLKFKPIKHTSLLRSSPQMRVTVKLILMNQASILLTQDFTALAYKNSKTQCQRMHLRTSRKTLSLKKQRSDDFKKLFLIHRKCLLKHQRSNKSWKK